jgi:CheY-like chemotaxis protein
VCGDSNRIRQILTNLVGNALKFTESGSIQIFVKQVELPENKVSLVCEVIDTGIGIPAGKISSLFDAFTQADASTTRKYGGTGLGLAISNKLCALMGGALEVTSEVDVGSRFSFFLTLEISDPIQEERKAKDNQSEKRQLEDSKVLLVEDVLVNQVVAQAILDSLNMSCDIANNGLEALAALSQNTYHLVLMDCQMPELDGYGATALIRAGECGANNSSIPIVAMTANAMKGDREKCLAAGMDDYISKPIDATVVKEKVELWLRLTN